MASYLDADPILIDAVLRAAGWTIHERSKTRTIWDMYGHKAEERRALMILRGLLIEAERIKYGEDGSED